MMRAVAAVVAAFLFLAIPVRAHVVIPAEFREVVSDASLIVRGRVTDVRSVVTAENGVESVATVALENVLKGQANGFVYVRVPGGDTGRSRVVMIGAPTFKVGQRAVFFLRQNTTDTTYRPIGLTLGVYRIQPEPGSNLPVVQPPLVGGVTASVTGPAVRGDSRRKPMAVQEFESLVRLVMASRPGQAVRRGGLR